MNKKVTISKVNFIFIQQLSFFIEININRLFFNDFLYSWWLVKLLQVTILLSPIVNNIGDQFVRVSTNWTICMLPAIGSEVQISLISKKFKIGKNFLCPSKYLRKPIPRLLVSAPGLAFWSIWHLLHASQKQLNNANFATRISCDLYWSIPERHSFHFLFIHCYTILCILMSQTLSRMIKAGLRIRMLYTWIRFQLQHFRSGSWGSGRLIKKFKFAFILVSL
jgi:hypothetical protein